MKLLEALKSKFVKTAVIGLTILYNNL